MKNNQKTVEVSENYLRGLEEALSDYVLRYGLTDLSRLSLSRSGREEPTTSEWEILKHSHTQSLWTYRALPPIL